MASPRSHSTAGETPASGTEGPLLYRCQELGCGRQFSRKYTLSEHMKTHTGERPHVCPVRSCAKRFTTSGNLARHKRLHGYIEPLECPVQGCICTFSSEGKRQKHMKFHYGGPVHVCEVPGCGKTFSTTGNLNRHMKTQHEDEAIDGMLMSIPDTGRVNKLSPTTSDGWQSEPALTHLRCRLKRAWSTGTNPLPTVSVSDFNPAGVESSEQPGTSGDALDTLSSLLVDTGIGTGRIDASSGDAERKTNLFDDIIRFHVEDLGYP